LRNAVLDNCGKKLNLNLLKVKWEILQVV